MYRQSLGSQSTPFDPATVRVLVVGAGGIGCEVLKNLCLGGFRRLDVIDLDTIDMSNLNRQFLFRKEHVNQSKIAANAVKSWFGKESAIEITPHHVNIMDSSFNLAFFKQFSIVLNALDNVEARKHVNRMCLASDVPLVESGSAGYLGQASCVIKDQTECYECTPKATPTQYPVCTIRSTPTKPIHCVVWAKMLFGRLFGEVEEDQHSVSAVSGWIEGSNGSVLVEEMFDAVFVNDIEKLRKMESMWKLRRKPNPVRYSEALKQSTAADSNCGTEDQRQWSLTECTQMFEKSVTILAKRTLSGTGTGRQALHFSKDDDVSLDFVTAVACVREYCFGIDQSTRFDVKSMAGNIIPAIATTNATVAGLAVLEAIKILGGRKDAIRTTYVRKEPSGRRLLMSTTVPEPNAQCFVCQHPFVELGVNIEVYKLSQLVKDVLQGELGMMYPTVVFGTSELYACGDDIDEDEQEDYEAMGDKTMLQLGVVDGSVLSCDDSAQDLAIKVTVKNETAHRLCEFSLDSGGRHIEHKVEEEE